MMYDEVFNVKNPDQKEPRQNWQSELLERLSKPPPEVHRSLRVSTESQRDSNNISRNKNEGKISGPIIWIYPSIQKEKPKLSSLQMAVAQNQKNTISKVYHHSQSKILRDPSMKKLQRMY